MSCLKNKLPLKTFGLVYPFEYDFKCHYNTIAPGHLKMEYQSFLMKTFFSFFEANFITLSLHFHFYGKRI